MLNSLAQCTWIAKAIGDHASEQISSLRHLERSSAAWHLFTDQALDFFRSLNEGLQGVSGTQKLSIATDLSGQIIRGLASLIINVAELDARLGASLFAELAGNMTNSEPQYYPALVGSIWKLGLLKRCVSKGSMPLRVWATEAMSIELVDAWRDHKDTPQGMQHPVLQSLADVVLAEKILDYIISVDSHPQIISRSSNIVGFLAVSFRYTKKEADAIWRTVTTSQDPQVASATLHMLTSIVEHMEVPALFYLCDKLEALPVQAISAEVFDLISRVLNGILNKNNTDESCWLIPFRLCVRLIKETTPATGSVVDNHAVYSRMSDELSKLAKHATSQDCCKIYRECAEDVRNKTQDAAASMRVIYTMARTRHREGPEELKTLVEDMDMTRLVAEEICSFVRTQSEQHHEESDLASLLSAMEPRLELLGFLISINPQSISEPLHDELLEHLVGARAINNEMRDYVWLRLASIARIQTSRHAFFDQCITESLPNLEPMYITPSLYKFLEEGVRYLYRAEPSIPLTEAGLLDLPGAGLIRHILLNAPEGILEEAAAKLLALLYLDEALMAKASREIVEATHIALIRDCIETLTSSVINESDGDHEDMVVEQDTTTLELRFTRILLFMSQLLSHVRMIPQLGETSGRIPKTAASKASTRGSPVKVNYQTFNGAQSDVRSFVIGDLETRGDLRRRLVELTRFSDFALICGGQWQILEDEPDMTLREWGIKHRGLLLVKKLRDAVYLDHYDSDDDGRSVIEREILKNFDTLCGFLAANDTQSSAVRRSLPMAHRH